MLKIIVNIIGNSYKFTMNLDFSDIEKLYNATLEAKKWTAKNS